MKKAPKKSTKPKLTPKQERFCREYFKDFNATQAAIRAKYSKKTAAVIACEYLRKPNIQARLKELSAKSFQENDLSTELILAECRRIALCDVGQAFDSDGNLLKIHDIPEDVRRAISGLDVEEIWQGKGENKKQVGLLKKVRFWSKDKQLENLFKHLGLFEANNKQLTDGFKDFLGEICANGTGLQIKC